MRAELRPAKGLEDVGRTSVKDSDTPRQSGLTGQRQMEKSCTGGARTSPTHCRKPKPVTKPSASQVACYVVTSAFGGAQRPGHRRRESLGEAGREGTLGSKHQLRPQLCPLRGLGQQHGTESRSDTPRKAPSPRGAREAVLTHTVHHPVHCAHHARSGGEGMRWPRQGRPAGAWPRPQTPSQGLLFPVCFGFRRSSQARTLLPTPASGSEVGPLCSLGEHLM